ncbi:MFS transporter [Elusimicrobiota bacterium]
MKECWRLFYNPNFKHLFQLRGLNFLNAEIGCLTLPFLIKAFTESPLWAGIVYAVFRLAIAFFNIPAGYFVDRFSPKAVMFISYIIRSAVYFGVGFLGYIGWLSLPFVALAYVMIGIFGVSQTTALRALVPFVVRKGQALRANSVFESCYNLASIIGPIVGGFVITYFGVMSGLCVQAIISLVMVVLTIQMPALDAKRTHAVEEKGDYLAGISYFLDKDLNSRMLLSVLMVTSLASGAIAVIGSIGVFYLNTVHSFDAKTIGILFSLTSVVNMSLTLQIPYLTSVIGTKRMLVFGSLFCSTALLMIGWADSSYLIAAAFILGDFGMSIHRVSWQSLCHTLVPKELMGRAIGAFNMFYVGVIPVSVALFGFMAKFWGYQTSFTIYGIICIVSIAPCFFGAMRLLDVQKSAAPASSALTQSG